MKKIGLCICLLLGVICFSASAKKVSSVYLLGVSLSFSDSTVYFTEIQQIENVKLTKKTGFLPHRQTYALELKNYMAEKENMPDRTSIIYFSKSRSSLQKKAEKVKKRMMKKQGMNVRYIGNNFSFTRPAYEEEKK